MAVLAKTVNRMITLDSHISQQFIKNFNENNKTSKEFLKSCERAGRLFNGINENYFASTGGEMNHQKQD